MIVSTPREPLWAWLNARIGVPWSSDFRAIGIVQDDCLKAVFGYNGFMGRVCSVHSAIDDPKVITRTFVQAVFSFPFVQCDIVQLLAPVPVDNHKAMEVNTRAGFKPLVTLEGADAEGKDLIVLSMRREECKWIPKEYRHGRKKQSSSA